MTPPVTSKRGSNVRPLRRPMLLQRRAIATETRPVRRVDTRVLKQIRLEFDVQKLRLEIARLQQVHHLLQEQALNRPDNHASSACRMVQKYFEIFARGYQVSSPKSDRIDPDTFLYAMMDDNVLGGGFRGVDVMIEQWKRYGSAFVGTKFQFLGAQVTSVDVDPETGKPTRIHVTATANYAGHLTLAGVQSMFPHVMTHPALVMELIGKAIGGLGSYLFVYDCKTKRVVENRINIDLVGAFSKVVQNPYDLGLLFGKALVSSQYYMGDDSHEDVHESVLPPSPTSSTSEEHELTGQQMRIDRILCESQQESF